VILFAHGFSEFWYAWREHEGIWPDYQAGRPDLPAITDSKPDGVRETIRARASVLKNLRALGERIWVRSDSFWWVWDWSGGVGSRWRIRSCSKKL